MRPLAVLLLLLLPSAAAEGDEDWESTGAEGTLATPYDAAVSRLEGVLAASAPLLLVPDEEGEVRYVSNKLSQFGHTLEQADALVAAIEAKYGADPPFSSVADGQSAQGAFRAVQGVSQAVGADRPSAKAKSVLEVMDRTPARRLPSAADTDEDFSLSIAEAQALFGAIHARKRVFLAQGDDKLHNISKKDAAEFSLLKYDADKPYVSQREFLSDDVALRDVITEKLIGTYFPIYKWLRLPHPRRGAIEAGMDEDSKEGSTNYEQLKSEETQKQQAPRVSSAWKISSTKCRLSMTR